MRVSAALVILMLTDGLAAAASIPLPRPRPADATHSVQLPSAGDREDGAARAPALARPENAAPSGADTSAHPQPTESPSACRIALLAVAAFQPLPPVSGPGGCVIADPVRLEAVILPDESRVAVSPAAELRCEMAVAVAHWIRSDMAPAVASLGAPLRGIENFDSYSCRGRNRVSGARLSEHGRGNALDIRAVNLADGTVARLTDAGMNVDVRTALRNSACARFTTVLGPGSDGYHEDHVHFDLAERRSGHRMCQWDIRTPAEPAPVAQARVPLPQPRPPAAGQRASVQR